MLATRHITVIVSAAVMVLGTPATYGQLEPNRPLRIVASGFGGGTDFVARVVASGLDAALGRPVVVDNRGSGVMPADVTSKASPDGHTLLVSTGGLLWVLPLIQKAPFDPMKDFVPISIVASFPTVLAVNASVPANSVKELIALAKAKPGTLNYVMTAKGGSAHLASELFKNTAGVNIVAVPYKNTGTGIVDLVAGRVHMFFSASGPVMPHVKAGRLKALAVTSAKPSPLLPGLPTVAASLPGYEMEGVYCLFAPAGTPAATIRFLNREVVRVLGETAVREKLMEAGIEPRGSTPAELDALRKSDMAKMSKLIKDAGIGAQ